MRVAFWRSALVVIDVSARYQSGEELVVANTEMLRQPYTTGNKKPRIAGFVSVNQNGSLTHLFM